jgi:hypothetical protein
VSKRRGILFEAAVAIVIVFLVFIVYYMVATSAPAAAVRWTTPTYDQPKYIYPGDNGTLYSFTGNSIYAFDSEGQPVWNVSIPDEWRISINWLRLKDTGDIAVGGFTGIDEVSPVVATSGGTLYVYARPNVTSAGDGIQTSNNVTAVFAISPEGSILWTRYLASRLITYGGASMDTASIHAHGDRVYVFHDYEETVIDRSGKVLFTIDSVSDPAAVD